MAVATKLQAQKSAAAKTTAPTTTSKPAVAAAATTTKPSPAPTTKASTATRPATAASNATTKPAPMKAAPPEEAAKPRTIKAELSGTKRRLLKAGERLKAYKEKEGKRVKLYLELQENGDKLTKGQQSKIDKYEEGLKKIQTDITGLNKMIAKLTPLAEKEASENEKARQLARLENEVDIVEWEHRALRKTEIAERNRIEGEMNKAREDAQTAMLAFAAGLREIKDKKLWVDYEGGFDAYCSDKWGLHRSNVNRQINVAKVFENLQGTKIKGLITAGEEGEILEGNYTKDKLPKNEAVARELMRAGDDKDAQVKAWNAALDKAAELGEDKPTAKIVREAVDELIGSGVIAKTKDTTTPRVKDPVIKGPLLEEKWTMFRQQTFMGRKYIIQNIVTVDKAGQKTYTFIVHIDGVKVPGSDGKPMVFGSYPAAEEYCQKDAIKLQKANDKEFEEAAPEPAKPAAKKTKTPPAPVEPEPEEEEEDEDEDTEDEDEAEDEDTEEEDTDDDETEDDEEEDEDDTDEDDDDESDEDDEDFDDDEDEEGDDDDEEDEEDTDDGEAEDDEELEEEAEEVQRVAADDTSWLS